jgi:hypothetical protein
MMSKRLKHPDLLFAAILFAASLVFRGLVLSSGYTLLLIVPLWMLIWHYALPTRTGWILILVFLLLPFLLVLQNEWQRAGLRLDLASMDVARRFLAYELVWSAAWVIFTAYASQVTREDA